MRELGIEGFGNYLDYLQANAEEFTGLLSTILINVTSFFPGR
jgi:two-component system CheB/CheR fusion protein